MKLINSKTKQEVTIGSTLSNSSGYWAHYKYELVAVHYPSIDVLSHQTNTIYRGENPLFYYADLEWEDDKSETRFLPRTNQEASDGWSGDAVCVSAYFANILERELIAAKKEIKELEAKVKELVDEAYNVARCHN